MNTLIKLPEFIQAEMAALDTDLLSDLRSKQDDINSVKLSVDDGKRGYMEIITLAASVITPILVEVVKAYLPRNKTTEIIERTIIIKTENGDKEVTEVTVVVKDK